MSGRIDNIVAGSPLTQRERDVLVFLGKGMSNREIGGLMSLSVHTINEHVKAIFRRLDVDTRVEAAVWACKQGWL